MIETRVIGLDKLNAGLKRGQSSIGSETRTAMETSLLLIEADARRNAPRDTGRLQGSITHSISGRGGDLSGRVGPSVRHGYYVEKGRRPGKMPPLSAIAGWARRHGVEPFVVARAIARRGTKPRPFLVPAYRSNERKIVSLFQKVGAKVVARIAS